MTLNRRHWPILALSLLAAGCAARMAPIRQGAGNFAGEAPLAVRAEQIRVAGTRRGWVITPQGPGWSRGTLDLRAHRAVVDIRFDARRFVIDYVSSDRLNFDGTSIHSNYNGWVRYLQDDIIRESGGQP